MGKIVTPHARELDTAIGARLRAFRLAAGKSQTELATAIGITFQQVQKYEKGTNRIGGSRMLAIAEVLDIKPSQLLGDNSHAAAIPFLSRAEANALDLFRRLKPRQQNAMTIMMRAALDEDDPATKQ